MHVTPLPSWITDKPFAHRGLHDAAAGVPENTMAAFDAAIASGYAIELDVRQMRDGAVVVFHDADLTRACGVDRDLAELAWGDVNQAGIFGTEHRIPLLDEVLVRTAGRVPLLIEVKEDRRHPGIERALHEKLSQYNGPFALQSFSPTIVRWFRKHPIGAPLGLVAGPLADTNIDPPAKALIPLASRRTRLPPRLHQLRPTRHAEPLARHREPSCLSARDLLDRENRTRRAKG